METAKIDLNVTQARKLADLLNKADWHASRNNIKQGQEYVRQAGEILKGVKEPEDPNAHLSLIFDTMLKAEGDLRVNATAQFASRMGSLRSLSIQALEHIEKGLYTPRAETSRGQTV